MKFVTFEVNTAIGVFQRIGVLRGQNIIDLHAAYASYLKEVRTVYRWREMAESLVPADMLKFIEGGLSCARILREDRKPGGEPGP